MLLSAAPDISRLLPIYARKEPNHMHMNQVPDGAELFVTQTQAFLSVSHRTELAKSGAARDAQKKSKK